eukprot:527502_1
MTSIRIPFESYAAQVAQNYNNSNGNFSRNEIDTTYAGPSVHDNNNAQFRPRVTFSIQSVDEDEDPEEKMHSPRTPYGSVPDSISNRNDGQRRFRFNNNNTNTLYPPVMDTMQRTVSASSFESIRSSSFDHDHDSMLANYAPTLSATSSINRSDLKAVYSTCSTPESASPCNTPKAYKLSLETSKMDDNDGEIKEDNNNNNGEIAWFPTLKEDSNSNANKNEDMKYNKSFDIIRDNLGASRISIPYS